MPPAVQQPDWVQYGSFGLVAFAVIVLIPTGFYVLWLVFNRMLASHETVVAKLSKTFEDQEEACRDERIEAAEKDRCARHEQANAIQKLNGLLEILLQRGHM
jgi:hypothetical protein